MKIQGACHCGRITYEAEVDPEKVAMCNCTDCQVTSSAPYRVSAVVPSGSFRLLSGQPKVYVKTAESGNKRKQAFCDNCGTAIYASAAEDNPAVYALRVGAMKQRAELAPKRQVWSRSALGWSRNLSAMPGTDKQ